MMPRVHRTSAYDLLIALLQARQWKFDQFSGAEFNLQAPSQRFRHSYKLRSHRNDDPDSLSFHLSRDIAFPWKQRNALQKTASRLNLGSGRFTFSINMSEELRLICASHIGRENPEHKEEVVEKLLDDAMVRMDCGWEAVQLVLHACKDPVDAVQTARLKTYGRK